MPTHTHDFSNNSDGYSHSKAAFVSSVGSQKSQLSMDLSFDIVPDSGGIYDF
jgi:hypothetical protein